MNRVYRLVWSLTRRAWIAASENARRKGKGTTKRTALTTVATALIVASACPVMAFAAPTATYTWDGGAGTSSWSDVANWNPDGLPSSSVGCGSCYDLLTFGDAAGGTLYNNVGWAYELQVNAGSGAYDMAGTQSMETYGITNLSSNLLTVSMNSLTLNFHTATWDAGSGGLSISSPLNLNNTLTITGSGDTTLSGNLYGTGSIAKEGTGTLHFDGTGTSYVLNINGGTVSADSDSSMSDMRLALSSGAVFEVNSANVDVGNISGSGGEVSLGSNTLTLTNNKSTSYAGTITGTGGSLVKTGSGTLTLSGNNSYSGGTTLSGGTISISSNNNLGNSFGSLTFDGGSLKTTASFSTGRLITMSAGGGTFNVDASITLTHSGTINGTGGLSKIGDGTLTLTGSNSYSGGTTVFAGTLQSGAAGAFVDNTDYTVDGGTLNLNGNDLTMSSLSGTGGNITLGSAALTVDQTADTSYDGSITGSGSLTKSGSGTLTLGASNGYGGGTTVSAGTLQSGVGGAFTSHTDYAVNGGILDLNSFNLTMSSLSGSGGEVTLGAALLEVNQSTNTSYAGSISGTGSVLKTGTGTLTLTGSNGYTGGTTVFSGTLQGDSTSLQGDITDNASVVFDQATAGTYAGSMDGSGSVTKSGSGTLFLTGSNSYSGGTTVSAGTLQGDTTSLQGNITNNANIVFNQTSDGTYANDMSGSGSLTKSGSGTLFLTGSNTYTGTTTINNGTLSVNGSTASATTVNTGGTLKGSGSVGSVTVNTGGTVAPGNSIGTLNVSGNIDYSGGGTYQVEVDDAGNSDKIIATGTATLTGGSVEILAATGSYNYSTDYTILTAATISGTFGSVSSNFAFLSPSLSYDSNNVYLTLTRNDVSFGDVSDTKNQRAVGNTLSGIASASPSGDMQTLINGVNTLTTSGAQHAYDSLSGVQHADAQSLLTASNGRFTGLLNARANRLAVNPGATAQQQAAFTPVQLAYNGDLADLQLASNGATAGLMDSQGSGFWLTPQGGTGSIDDTENASGAHYTWYGLYGGADKWLDNHRLVGFALGVSHTDANPAAGDINLDSLELAAYGRWQDDKRYLDASLNVGRHRTDSARRVSVGSLSRTASADYDAQSLGLSLEAGQTTYEQGDQRMTPFIGLRYAHLSRDGFTETGAGSANLVVDSDTQQSLQGRLGVRTEQHSESASGRRLDWDVSLAWAREFMDNTGTLKAGFEGAPSTTFSIDGPALDRNRVQLGIGLTTDIGKAMTLRIGYNGELAGSDQSHSASANIRISW